MTRKEKILCVVALAVIILCIALGGMIDQISLADSYIH